MVTHGVVSEHPVVLSFSDLSVWCYLCEAYVHNQVTRDLSRLFKCSAAESTVTLVSMRVDQLTVLFFLELKISNIALNR